MSNAQRLPQGLVVSEIPDIDPSSIVDIRSSEKGLLIPRMTTAERESIASPATGLMVYDNTLNDFYYFDGTEWVALADSNKFIPLAGTDLGNPVTGNIEFSDSASTGMYSENEFMRRQILFSDEQDMLIKSDTFASSYGEFHVRSSSTESVVNDGTYTSNLFVGTDGVNVSATNPASQGIAGAQDFSPNYGPLTYVQEKYVVPITGTRIANPITGMLVSDYAGGKAHRSNVSTQFYAPGADSDEFSIYNASGFGINQDPDGNSFNSVFPNFTGESGLSVLWRHPNTAGDFTYASQQYVDDATGTIADNFVPYSGATSGVDLGNQSLKTTSSLESGEIKLRNIGEPTYQASITSQTGLSADSTSLLPTVDGTLVNSVNGESPNATGNVEVIINLSSQVSGTLPITSGGTGNISVGTAFQSLVTNSAANGLVYDYRTREVIDNTTTVTGTGTISAQKVFSQAIPANTLVNGSTLNLTAMIRRTGTNANMTIRVLINDTDDLTTPTALGQYTLPMATMGATFTRTFKLSGNTLTGNTGATSNSIADGAGNGLSVTYNTNTQYFLIIEFTDSSNLDIPNVDLVNLKSSK